MDEVVCSPAGFTRGVTRQTCKYPVPGLSFLFNSDLPSRRVKRSRSDPGLAPQPFSNAVMKWFVIIFLTTCVFYNLNS